MASFSYLARDRDGNRVTGRLDALTEAAALTELSARGLAPVRVAPAALARARGQKIAVRQLARTYQQLADLLRAGVPLLKALRLLGRGRANPALAAIMASIAEDVSQGERLADSMSRHARAFPPVQIAMVRAGERGGFLDQVLARLGSFLTHQADLRSRIVGSLVYPIVLVFMSLAVVLGALIFVVPKVKPYYAKIEVPLATTLLLHMSDFVVAWWPLIIFFTVGAVIAIVLARRDPRVERAVADLTVRLPLLGLLLRSLAAARLARTLGTLLENGIPILQAMQISRDAAGHPALAESVDSAAEAVRAGDSLAAPLSRSGFLEEDVVEMISVGESANNLPQVLQTVADSLEARNDRALAMFLRLLEPLFLLALGLMVLFIFVAIIMPMMKLSSAL